MATSQKNQPSRGNGSDQQSFGKREKQSGSDREYSDQEVKGENSMERDAFKKDQRENPKETFDRNDEGQSIDNKKPKMSKENDDDDDMDMEEGDEETSEVENENNDYEDDESDSIPGKD